ncbi:MAG TPA: NAD-dependent epimerase/dehydratase family protein [Gemmatimonadaceae bacterium]|nr:NAD-dependent epimerase/dehydratase family protein [Gemmatimonadaceae bacterium]
MGRGSARTALVTGAAGFAGQWLCRDLVRHGWSVTGSSLTGDPGPGILSPEDHAPVVWRREDLRDAGAVHDALDAARPDAVFHLAGVAFVPAAGDDPMLAFDVNVGCAVRLLREIRERRAAGTLDPAVLIVGSGEQYGRHDVVAMPLGEEAECRPCSLYAATKLAQEVFALEAFRADGVRVVCTRSFNHSGRGQHASFLLPALVERARAARAGARAGRRAKDVAIGNTDTVRDFLHVEDVVRAYVLLAERGLAGEVYNVCSGEGVPVGEIAREVLTAAGVDAPLVGDDALRRPVDIPVLVGRNDKVRADTGWAPRRTRATIIADLLHAAAP